MRPADLLLGLFVVLVWGVNFAVIKIGVATVPPLLLVALRFVLAAFPALLFVRPPRIALRWYILYGLTISVGQFSLLFTAIHIGMPSGLASLVLQSQAFFTMIFAAFWLREGFRAAQVAGLCLSAIGLILIGSAHGVSMPIGGFLLTVLAASMWAAGNIVTRAMNRENSVNQFSFVVWSSLVPIPPMLAASLLLEGPQAIGHALLNYDLKALGATAYLAWAATLLGYGLWTRLMARYPAGTVAPLSLLVPVIGMSTGWLAFGEELDTGHIAGGLLVMAGLAVNVFGSRLRLFGRRGGKQA